MTRNYAAGRNREFNIMNIIIADQIIDLKRKDIQLRDELVRKGKLSDSYDPAIGGLHTIRIVLQFLMAKMMFTDSFPSRVYSKVSQWRAVW